MDNENLAEVQVAEDTAIDDAEKFWQEFDEKDSGKSDSEDKGDALSPKTAVPEEPAPEETPPVLNEEGGEETPEPEDSPDEPETPDDETPLAAEADPLAEARAQLAKYEHEVKSHRGRQAALQREIEELKALVKGNGAADKKEEPTKEEDFFGGEDWQKFQTEYDEVAKPIRSAIEKMVVPLKSHISDLSQTIERLNAERMHEQVQILENEHPGFDDFLKENADQFNYWINNQARIADYRIYESNYKQIQNGRATSEMLGRFKAYLSGEEANAPAPVKTPGPSKPVPPPPQAQPLSSRRTAQLRSSLAPRSKPQTPSLRTEIPGPNDPSVDSHWSYFERLEKEGRL